MIGLKYSEVANALQAELRGQDGVVGAISTDTRMLPAGSFFVALKGKNYDGHNYLDAAVQGGAAAIMVNRVMPVSVPQIVVADTLLGLGYLARLWRKKFSIPIIGVTGSNGKTTVKEMIAAILSESSSVLSTKGNLNNEIGVPLTLARLEKTHQFAVIEMGANHHGEIAYLSSIVLPDISVITNAGPAHLEGFGSVEGVAHAKGEILARLARSGTAVFNADDAYASVWDKLSMHSQQISFSMQKAEKAKVLGCLLDNGMLSVELEEQRFQLRLPVSGVHYAYNALAAIAATFSVGAKISQIVAGLEKLKPVPGRLNIFKGVNRLTILDDTYNANPASVAAGLQVLTGMRGQSWLVLGDMGELGADSEIMHRDIGKLARQMGVRRLLALGRISHAAAQSFGEGACCFTDYKELVKEIAAEANEEVNVLVKGSRAMRMEYVVQGLVVDDGAMSSSEDKGE